MPSLKRYSLYAAVYLFAGFAVLMTHYLQVSPYNKAAIDEKLTLVAASHFAISQLVDNLPSVFRENSHAAALKITDLKGSFLGAMYDSRRMTAEEYKTFLDTKVFDPKYPSPSGYEFHLWESKRRKLRIVTLSLKRMQVSEYLASMGQNYSLHYIIPLYILAGFLGLFVLHYFFATVSNKLPSLKMEKKPSAMSMPTVVKMPPQTAAKAWHIKSGIIAESTIQTMLARLSSLSGAATVSLFARHAPRGDWAGVTQIRGGGALAIRGEAMATPALLKVVRHGADPVMISADSKECLFFNDTPKTAQVCFALQFSHPDDLPRGDLKNEIVAFIKTNTRSLLTEHYYENSILDSESGLYSTPYAMFSLKEKMLAGQPFTLALFQFSDTDFTAVILPKIARTAIRVMRENFSAEEAPTIARGQANTIIIVFNSRKKTGDTQLKATQQLRAAYGNLGKRIAAAAIEDACSCGSSARAIKTLERLVDKSGRTNNLELYRTGQPLNII